MKVFISVDIEGIGGIVAWDQTSPGSQWYEEARALMTAECNAAIAGAFDGGATEVLVVDSHGNQRNMPITDIDPRARIITGGTKPLSMVQGIDESCDAVFFIGYHAGAGYEGVLAHTYDGTVNSVKLNSLLAGEVTVNGAVAGFYGVPVALVTGDSTVCREALSISPEAETVVVKEPISRYSANCLSPKVVREKIRAAAKSAVSRVSEMEPFTLEPPFRFEFHFNNVGFADKARIMPGTERISPLCIAYEANDYITAFRGFLTILELAESVA